MQFWETIINSAMMGTDKMLHAPSDVPANLADTVASIDNNPAINKEEKFLQIATLAYNYRMSGVMAVKQEVSIPPAAAEEKPYCSPNATQVLKDILYEENISILQYWLAKCAAAQQIVPPELVPELLGIGVHQKKLQTSIAACCGKRGEWLSKFNNSWLFSIQQTDEELWHNGTFEQRKQVLAVLRKTDPAAARNLLEATWGVEDANTKAGFLELLHVNVREEDVPFLESLATEKSKKVKEEALELLRMLPGSAIVRSYEDILRQSVVLVKEKALLGLMSKTTLQFRAPAEVPAGIDKLSPDKEVSDEAYILSQLTALCPPAFWEAHLQCSPAEVIEQFSKSATGTALILALASAASRFKAGDWASLLLKPGGVFHAELVPLVSKKEKEAYLTGMLLLANPQNAPRAIEAAAALDEEWSQELAEALFKFVRFNPYTYSRSFFSRIIHLIPAAILPSLEKFGPPDEYSKSIWNSHSEYVRRMFQLKTQLQKAFNA